MFLQGVIMDSFEGSDHITERKVVPAKHIALVCRFEGHFLSPFPFLLCIRPT